MLPARGVNLTAFYAYTDAHYNSLNVINTTTGLPLDLSDTPFANTPKHKLGLTGTVTTTMEGVGELSFSGSYTYQSTMVSRVPLVPPSQLDPQFGQPSYSLVNLRADLRDIGGRPVDLGVFVNNATNKTYEIFENSLYPDPAGVTGVLYGEPRMWGVVLRYRFGG